MNRFIFRKSVAAAAIGLGAIGVASAAHAGSDVRFSIGLQFPGGYAQIGPVYGQPAPVYVRPAPIYVRPAPVAVQPVYGYGYQYRHEYRHGPATARPRCAIPARRTCTTRAST